MKEFSISVLLTRDQFKNFQWEAVLKFKPFYQLRIFWAILFLTGIGIAHFMKKDFSPLGNSDVIYYFFAVSSLFTGSIAFTVLKKAGKTYDSNIKLQKPIDYTFNEKGITTKGYNFESTHQWAEIHKISRTKKYFLIYISTTAMIMIPINMLSDEQMKFVEDTWKKIKK